MAYNLYKVHATTDKDSPIIFEGIRKEVCHELDIDERFFYSMNNSHDCILNNMYYVEKCTYKHANGAKKARDPKFIKPVKKKTKFDKKIESIEWHLDIYGNTIIYKDYEKINKRLEKDGYFVTALHEPERVIKYTNISGEGDRDIYSECWILTLVRKETIDV